MHDRWPALVVRATSAGDVARTVRFAAEEGSMLAVRGGNHSMRGHGSCDDGVTLDLARLNAVEVDRRRGMVRVGGGATWSDVNAATHAHGLATTGGLISSTGVAGLTLGGGIGYLTRRLGLACDNLLAAELVTARGEIVTVDDAHEPELFWAIRGGGGNFGVVTAFTFRLAPVDRVIAGPMVFPANPEVLQRYDAAMHDAPRELGAILGLTIAPPLPFLAPEHHGQPCAVVVACWSGTAPAADSALASLESIGPLLGNGVRAMPYPEVNTLFDALLPWGLRHYWKSTLVRELTPRAAERFVEHGRETPTIESGIFFYPVDGAAHDVGPNATAWPHRDARYVIGIHGSWRDVRQDTSISA
ncbi:MAG: FAD-binding oxidoreductase, partial [Gemmatimonadaceae bacterium]